MDWQKLDLAKASVLKREVDVALQRMYDTNPEVSKSKLCSSVQYRVQELDNFCARNSDDERVILFEKERLRLRKALQSQSSSSRSVDNRSTSPAAISTNSTSGRVPTSATKAANTENLNNASASASASVRTTRTMSSKIIGGSVSPTPNRSISGLNSTITDVRPMSHASNIYAWEDSNERAERVPLEVSGVVFLPSKVAGFYSRQDTLNPGVDTTPLPEKYVDFQIILTAEELTTLAARKKTATSRVGVAPRGLPAPSLSSSTPYIDPRRIQKDLLRPTNPDKWMDPEGLRAYKKGEKI